MRRAALFRGFTANVTSSRTAGSVISSVKPAARRANWTFSRGLKTGGSDGWASGDSGGTGSVMVMVSDEFVRQ